jgi:hypothetical protein
MGNGQREKRKYPRYSVSLDVTVYIDSAPVQARITNLSRGGCLIYPPLPFTPNPEVKLSILLPDDSSPINCKGEIVYTVHDRGTGIALTEISLHNQERMAEFLEKQPATS